MATTIALLKAKENTMLIDTPETMVLYLDKYLFSGADRNNKLDEIESLSKDCNCVIYTSTPRNLSRLAKSGIQVKAIGNQYTAAIFSQLAKERMSALCFVSDNGSFLADVLKSLCATVLITDNALPYTLAGNCPDMICKSISELKDRLTKKKLFYCGESLFNERKRMNGMKKDEYMPVIRTKKDILEKNRTIEIFAAGRYYGKKHFMQAIDRYSCAIQCNKNTNSKLFLKFNDRFETILFLMLAECRGKSIGLDSICAVPPKPGKTDRFSSIVKSLSEKADLENITENIQCIQAYRDNKMSESLEDRIANVHGSFKATGNLSGKTIALLDDIVTTGTTVSECAKELLDAGANDVVVFSLAINQFSCPYWISGSSIMTHQQENPLHFNSHELTPFFSGCTRSFESEFSNLISVLEEEKTCFIDGDDDDSILF